MNIKISRAVMVMEVEKGCGITDHTRLRQHGRTITPVIYQKLFLAK